MGCSGGKYDGEFKVQVAKLLYSLLTYQKVRNRAHFWVGLFDWFDLQITIEPDLLAQLLHNFLSSLATTHPPDELFYVSAIIVNLGISPEVNPKDFLISNILTIPFSHTSGPKLPPRRERAFV